MKRFALLVLMIGGIIGMGMVSANAQVIQYIPTKQLASKVVNTVQRTFAPSIIRRRSSTVNKPMEIMRELRSTRVEADGVAFAFTMGGEWTKKQDTLTNASGIMRLEGENKGQIKVEATSQICSRTQASANLCLQQISDDAWTELQRNDRVARLSKKEALRFRESNRDSESARKSYGWYWIADTVNGRQLHMTFIRPQTDNVWSMEIMESKDGMIVNDARIINLMLKSIFEAWSDDSLTKNEVTNINRLQSIRDTGRFNPTTVRGAGAQRNSSLAISGDFITVKHNLDLEMSIPKNFVLESDTLTLEGGEWLFVGENQEMIQVTRTDGMCSFDTVPQQRECLNAFAAKDSENDRRAVPTMRVLTDENYNLNLRKDMRSAQHAGKYYLFLDGSMRKANVYFIKPETKVIWKMQIEAQNNSFGLLNGNIVVQKILQSLQF